jgi:DNA-binding SARP family transcriptional activator
MKLTLSLLGEVEVRLDDNIVEDLSAQKAQALLFYLVVESSRAHRREFLAEMLWPEKPPGYARNNLKQALSQLKKALGDKESETPYLISSKRDLQFNAGSLHWVDVLELERLLQKTNNHQHENATNCESCLENLRQSAKLYRDDFLSDFYLPDSPDFNEWTLTKREYYRRLIVDSLNKLINFHEHRREYNTAAAYAKNIVELEPWSESSHRRLMALLAASGKRSAALKQFQTCKSILASEFEVQPSPDTIALYEKIKDWKIDTSPSSEDSLLPSNQDEPILVADPREKPEKSLSSWIKVTALVSFLALASILYLVFFRDTPNPAITVFPDSGIKLVENQTSGTNPFGKDSRSYLSDPNQICLEGERLLYIEDFQDGQAQGWPEIEFRAQNWDITPDPVVPGNLVTQNPGLGSTILTYQEDTFQNAVFRCNFLLIGKIQPIFIWQSNNEAYQEERGLVTSSDYSIGFMDYGTHFERFTHPNPAVILHSEDFQITNDIWHQIEISTYQGMLRIWLDGEELLAYQDPNPLPAGTIGIGLGEPLAEGSMVYFDNLSVCELGGPFKSIITKQ